MHVGGLGLSSTTTAGRRFGATCHSEDLSGLHLRIPYRLLTISSLSISKGNRSIYFVIIFPLVFCTHDSDCQSLVIHLTTCRPTSSIRLLGNPISITHSRTFLALPRVDLPTYAHRSSVSALLLSGCLHLTIPLISNGGHVIQSSDTSEPLAIISEHCRSFFKHEQLNDIGHHRPSHPGSLC